MTLTASENYVDFYSEGFFGYGEKGDFKLFSVWHFIPVLLLIAAIVLTYVFREKIKTCKHERLIRMGLGIAMLIVEMGYYWRIMYAGSGDPELHTLLTKLPVQVCEWTCIFAALMVLTESKFFFDIDVFVCLTLGLAPLIFPTVIPTTGPRYFRYYQFWGEHILPVYSVFYMMFVKGCRFDWKQIYKPLAFLVTLAMFCIFFNYYIPEASYMYLQGSTIGEPFASILPDNQFARLAIFTPIALGLFGVEILIFWLIRRQQNKKSKANPE